MVTGDNIFTAKAIAQECGILEDNKGLVVEGKDFRTWDAVQLDRDLKHLSVSFIKFPELLHSPVWLL
jgi:Ca2+-transporting ATPase